MGSFVSSYTVAVNFLELAELDDRAFILAQSIELLKIAIPCSKTRQTGTAMGCVLHSFPPARKMFEDAVLHKDQLEVTAKLLKPFQMKLEQFTVCLQSIAGCMLQLEDGTITSLCTLGRQTCVLYTSDLHVKAISEFVLTVDGGVLQVPLQLWLLKALMAAIALLEPVMKCDADDTTLRAWVGLVVGSIPRMPEVIHAVSFMSPMMAPTPLYNNLITAQQTLACLHRMPEVVDLGNQISSDELQKFGKSRRASVFADWIVDPVSEMVGEFKEKVDLFLQSALIRPDGICMRQMQAHLTHHSAAALLPVLDAFKLCIGSGGGSCIRHFSEVGDAELEQIAAWSLPPEHNMVASQWAKDSGDNVLVLQLQGLNMLSQAQSTCAKAQVLIKSKDLATLSTNMNTTSTLSCKPSDDRGHSRA